MKPLAISAMLAAPLLLVAACGDSSSPTPVVQDNGLVTAAPAPGNDGALGLTEAQLRDADLVDANGVDLGDVEGVVRGADGAITDLLVEIEDTSPDREVLVPIAGLTAVRNGNDWDVRTDTLTREQLMALPEVRQ